MAYVPPTAATITPREVLDLLDGEFAAFALGVAENRYAVWLGSGISLGRVEGLRQVVPRVLEFLRSRIVNGVANCRFRDALDRALALASPSPPEVARFDFAQPFSQWPDADSLTARLIQNYSKLLDVTVLHEAEDYLLWQGIDVVGTYANPALEPDVEHICIAIMILEGAFADIASANWDGLVEKAVSTLTNAQPALVVCACSEDLREPDLKGRLLKFHGCAVKARADEAGFRRYLVARYSQISGWVTRHENQALVEQLINLIATKPTLMMGLSAQDTNIQHIFAYAQDRMPWQWPGDRPSYVFSEDKIGVDQEVLLRNVYREQFSPQTREQIFAGALIRAYAKPLLVALVLHVLSNKLKTLIGLAPGGLGNPERQRLVDGIVVLRNQLAAAAQPNPIEFVRALCQQNSRLFGMFRDGQAPNPLGLYNPLTQGSIQHIPGDPNLQASGLRELAVAIGMTGLCVGNASWTLESADVGDAQAGMLKVKSATGTARIFFVVNSYIALQLRQNGHLAPDDDAVVVHSRERIPAQQRSPRGTFGRTGRAQVRETSVAELLAACNSVESLVERFRQEVAI